MRKLASLLLIGALLSSCSSGALRYAGAAQPAEGIGFRESAEVEWNCNEKVDAEGGGAIAGPLIGIAVDTAIGAISSAIARAQKARTGSWTATQAIPVAKCLKGELTVRRGVYSGATGAVLDGEVGPNGKQVFPSFELKMSVKIENIEDPGKPQSAILTLQPQSLKYADTAARSRGSGRKEVTVAVGFTGIGPVPTTPADTEAGGAQAAADGTAAPPAGAILLNLGKLEIGREYNSFALKGATAVPAARLHTASVIVTESEEASAALDAFAAAFEANKGDLSTALKDAFAKALKSSKKEK